MKECMNMNGEEIKDTLKKYNLQSWSKQRNTNPIPDEKGEGIYHLDKQLTTRVFVDPTQTPAP